MQSPKLLLPAWSIGLSISESPDLAQEGLGKLHLRDALTEISRHLLAAGAKLVYGGHLGPAGFTLALFELAASHYRDIVAHPEDAVTNYVPWPVHMTMTADQIRDWQASIRAFGTLVCVARDGTPMTDEQRHRVMPAMPGKDDFSEGLSAMRRLLTERCHARVLLGGKVEDFKGDMPGVAEEALLALDHGVPVYLAGGFGGCARDIAEEMGLADRRPRERSVLWPERSRFASYSAKRLNNGLTLEENKRLADTVHIDEILTLMLSGLQRRAHARKRRPPGANKRPKS
jgi:hypothetical protein